MCQVVKVFSNYRNFRLQPKCNLNKIINLCLNKFIILNLWLNVFLEQYIFNIYMLNE